jgi:hypothetical protein
MYLFIRSKCKTTNRTKGKTMTVPGITTDKNQG